MVLVFFSLVAVIALIFSLLNFHLIEVNFYITSIKMPLALALTIELFAGIFIGFLAAFIHILKLKSEYKILSKRVPKTDTANSK